MDDLYKVKVNDRYDFEITDLEATELDAQKISAMKFHLLKEGKSFKAQITQTDFFNRTYTVKIGSNSYTTRISDALDILIDDMGLSLGEKQKINTIMAPMPGLILDINVREGDTVKEGDYLMVLEAMKMENTLSAPGDAVVKTINVKKGETVEKNQLLIEME